MIEGHACNWFSPVRIVLDSGRRFAATPTAASLPSEYPVMIKNGESSEHDSNQWGKNEKRGGE